MSLFQPTTTPIPIEQQIANAVLTKSNALFAHMIQFYNNNYQVERCSIRIAEILKEENCKLEIGMLITAQGNIPQLQVVSLN